MVELQPSKLAMRVRFPSPALRLDPKTQVYMARRRADGLSKMDVLRCLKRFIAQEVYNALKMDLL